VYHVSRRLHWFFNFHLFVFGPFNSSPAFSVGLVKLRVNCRPGTCIDFERVPGYPFERQHTVNDTGTHQSDPIRVLLALVSQPLISYDQAGRLLATERSRVQSQPLHCRVRLWTSCSHTLSSASGLTTLWRYINQVNLKQNKNKLARVNGKNS